MIFIGCHLSVSDGYEAMGKKMLSLGGTTFAWFTRNPRGGKTKEIIPEDVSALQTLLQEHSAGPLAAHGSYTMNLCSGNPTTRENGLDMMKKDLERMELLPGNYYNFHPGSHTGQGTETGIRLITDALNQILTPNMNTTILLETMAGKGSEVGGRFEELREIMDRVNCGGRPGNRPDCRPGNKLGGRLGVCLDTCHVWDAGYDIVHDPDGVLQHFDDVIGLEHLCAVHFNDSKNDCGSHKDRHEKLGQGRIGMEAMRRLALHPALQGKPFILETPNDEDGYRREIHLVREWTGT